MRSSDMYISLACIEPQSAHKVSINQPSPPFQADRLWASESVTMNEGFSVWL